MFTMMILLTLFIFAFLNHYIVYSKNVHITPRAVNYLDALAQKIVTIDSNLADGKISEEKHDKIMKDERSLLDLYGAMDRIYQILKIISNTSLAVLLVISIFSNLELFTDLIHSVYGAVIIINTLVLILSRFWLDQSLQKEIFLSDIKRNNLI